MTNKKKTNVLPQTVLQVLKQFVDEMLADPDIPNDAIRRLEQLLHEGAVPKPDEINSALFKPPSDGE